MRRSWLPLLLATGCGGQGKLVAPAIPEAWCSDCDGKAVFAPGATVMVQTEWEATCAGGTMRDDDQLHPCHQKEHTDVVTCSRTGGGGACSVTVLEQGLIGVTPTELGTYEVAVTMQARGSAPFRKPLGTIVVDRPDHYAVTCTRWKYGETSVHVAARRGTDTVTAPQPTIDIPGVTCAFDLSVGGFAPDWEYQCKAGTTDLRVTITSPLLEATESVTCAREPGAE